MSCPVCSSIGGHCSSTSEHPVLHTDELQARQRLHEVAQFSAASNPITSRAAEQEEGESGHSDTQSTTNGKTTHETNITTSISSSGGGNEEKEDEDPVIQSAVMLRFGAEVPSLVAAGKCGRTVQFPIPDDWNDPEVCVMSRKQDTSTLYDNTLKSR